MSGGKVAGRIDIDVAGGVLDMALGFNFFWRFVCGVVEVLCTKVCGFSWGAGGLGPWVAVSILNMYTMCSRGFWVGQLRGCVLVLGVIFYGAQRACKMMIGNICCI